MRPPATTVSVEYTQTPYRPFGYTLAPDYMYSGSVPVGYGFAWQGVQKINGISQVGTRWAADYLLNLTAVRESITAVNKVNPTAQYVGPGIANAQANAAASMAGVNGSAPRLTLAEKLLAKLKG